MSYQPTFLIMIGRHSLIATALAYAFTVIGGIVPQVVWVQAGGVTDQVKKSAEGGWLFDSGAKAYEQGHTSEAARLWEQAWAADKRELGEDHPNTLDSMNNLALT